MNIIGQGTTPYLQIAVAGYDLNNSDVIYVTVTQGKKMLNLTGERISVVSDGTDSVVTAHLTQQETLMFDKGTATVQVRWKEEEEAYSTEAVRLNFFEALYREVI